MRLPAPKPINRLKPLLAFTGISLLFIFSQAICFQGFNGGDDLHYSWLAAKLLQGTYSPFRLDDIFSGRTLLILIQAAVYRMGGISTFTTQAASYTAVVGTGYLTVFHLLNQNNSTRKVITAASLFYFNPVLAGITLGAAPDPFIMLCGVLLVILLTKATLQKNKKPLFLTGVGCGLLIFSTLLIKESGLVFLPFAILIALLQCRQNRWWMVSAVVSTFLLAVLGCGIVYYMYTGDFLFRVHQIEYSFYPNPCYYASFFQKDMLVRLTYGVWHNFFASGFYPVLLATVAIFLNFTGIAKGNPDLRYDYKSYFLALLAIALYFPFSFRNYQPLCFKARHFLFLLPLAVVISTQYFEQAVNSKKNTIYRNAFAAILLAICVSNFLNGWYWNMIRCLLAWFVFIPFSINKRLAGSAQLVLALSLWLYLPYRSIFEKMDWYKTLSKMSTHLDGNVFYLPDHDNYMHWKLLKYFDTTVHMYDFDQRPYNNKPYPYYDSLRFHPGWFIVNKQYTIRSNKFLSTIDSLQKTHFFEKTEVAGAVSANYISRKQQFAYLVQLMDEEKRTNCNCGLSSP